MGVKLGLTLWGKNIGGGCLELSADDDDEVK
jgi:hypothetical protein